MSLISAPLISSCTASPEVDSAETAQRSSSGGRNHREGAALIQCPEPGNYRSAAAVTPEFRVEIAELKVSSTLMGEN